jgi:hypothetical protein
MEGAVDLDLCLCCVCCLMLNCKVTVDQRNVTLDTDSRRSDSDECGIVHKELFHNHKSSPCLMLCHSFTQTKT